MGSDNKPGEPSENPPAPYHGPDYGLWAGNFMVVFLVGLAAIYFVSLLRSLLSADYSRIPYSEKATH